MRTDSAATQMESLLSKGTQNSLTELIIACDSFSKDALMCIVRFVASMDYKVNSLPLYYVSVLWM